MESWAHPAFFGVACAFFDRLLSLFHVVHNHPNNCCGLVDLGGFLMPRVFELTLLRKEPGASPAALARAFVDAVVDVLVAKCALALSRTGLRQLVIAGGVGANRQLRAALDGRAATGAFEVFYPEPALCTDNGAMIAWAGAERLAHGLTDPLDTAPRARWPVGCSSSRR